MDKNVKLANESAMGIFVFTWGSGRGRCEVCWAPEMAAPTLSFYVSTLGRMSAPLAVLNPERFGWKPGKQTLMSVRAFAQHLANEAEKEIVA